MSKSPRPRSLLPTLIIVLCVLLIQVVISALLMAFPFLVVIISIKILEYFGSFLWPL